MWITHRQYRESGSDFEDLCRFVIALNRETPCEWSLGRLVDWKFGLWSPAKREQGYFARTTRLWFTQLGDLVGLAISENGTAEYFVAAAEKYGFLYDEILGHVLGAHPDSPVEVACLTVNEPLWGALHRQGFTDVGECETTYVYDLPSLVNLKVDLPQGHQVLGMDLCGDDVGQIELKRQAFRGGATLGPGDYFAYGHVRTSPLYDPQMDLVVLDEGRRILAGCEGFIDHENRILEVERVCTLPDFRRRGLARAAVIECLHRGIRKGLKRVQITGWNHQTKAFYGSLGDSRILVKRLFRGVVQASVGAKS